MVTVTIFCPISDEAHLSLDVRDVLRAIERRGRRLAGLARPADRLEPVLESRGHDRPEHLERDFAVVLDVMLHEASDHQRRAWRDAMPLAVDLGLALAFEDEKDLVRALVRMAAYRRARLEHLHAGGDEIVRRVVRAHLHRDISRRGFRLPIRLAFLRADEERDAFLAHISIPS